MTAPSQLRRPFFLYVLLFCLFVLGIGAAYALFGVLITVLTLLPLLRAYYKQA